MWKTLVLATLLAACGGSSSKAVDAGSTDGATADGAAADAAAADAGSCTGTSTSNLTGVALAAHGPCRFTLAQARAGISVPYDLTIQSDVASVVPTRQFGCATPAASGLYVFEDLAGSGQHYCLCDEGRCLPPSTTPVTLHASTTTGTFQWDGVNWTGPSDTGQPKGAAFPAGTYTFRVSATGTANGTAFEVAATYPITLTP